MSGDQPRKTTRGLASEACHHVAQTLLNYQKDAQAVVVIEAFKTELGGTGVSCVALERNGVDPKKWILAVYNEIHAMAVMAGAIEGEPKNDSNIIQVPH